MSTPLPLSSPFTQKICAYLKQHKALSSGVLGLPKAKYQSTDPMSVPVQPAQGAQPLQCWFNIQKEVRAGNGIAIFGWALWDGPFETTCAAQHHAVLLKPNNEYVCVTPSESGATTFDSITFIADERVPFDYEKLRQPPLLMLNKSGPTPDGIEFLWTDIEYQPLPAPGAWNTCDDNFMMVKMAL